MTTKEEVNTNKISEPNERKYSMNSPKHLARITGIFWGLVVIAIGIITLAQIKGYIPFNQPFFWAGVFGAVSAATLILYFVSGIQNWTMLFPAGVFGGLAVILMMVANNVTNSGLAAPLFIGIGIPFIVAFFLDRIRNWWAAIVTYVMFVLSLMPLVSMISRPELAGILVIFAIALPFFVVYSRAPLVNTWALIPAGMLSTATLVTAIVLAPGIPSHGYDDHLAYIILSLGMSATFAVIWLRHQKSWARVFTLLALVGAVANMFRGNIRNYWPVLVVVAGLFLLYNAYRSNRTKIPTN